MWILWLSTAANATRAARAHFFAGACSFCKCHVSRAGSIIYLRFRITVSGYPNKICNEFKVVEAFAYIIFIISAFFFLQLFRVLRDLQCSATRSG
jgi:hypothetical protein